MAVTRCTGYNKLPARALFSSFSSVDEARKVLPEFAKDYLSLNGEWSFHFSKNPDERPKDFFAKGYDDSKWDRLQVPVSWNMAGIQKDGTLKYGVPIYVNQWVIFKYNIEPGDWKKGVMREPPKNYTTYEYRNEVGSFRRSFDIPTTWDGKEVYLNFDGVDSFFYLWINGRYVGFSKNSRNTAQFDITPYITKGKNEVAVEIYRSSDGSFLEAQDMFRLPGIFRNVSVTATPKVHIADVKAIPSYTDGKGIETLTQHCKTSLLRMQRISTFVGAFIRTDSLLMTMSWWQPSRMQKQRPFVTVRDRLTFDRHSL